MLASLVAFFKEAPPPGQHALPLRVQRLVDEQENESERLIGWVQLGVVATISMLYLIAPRPADAPRGVLLEPVPVALAAYALFTVGRLRLAYRRRLPGSVLLISILADVGLLLALIWAFHTQYGQAAPFSLKVPTFVYLFVFIALRALRFDHRYVLAAGLAAGAGWMLLLVAVLASSGMEAITRSFVAHINSNRVLLGAEFERLLTLLLMTGVLAFAVKRGRHLFVTAIRDEAALRDLTRFFGQGVSDTLVRSETQFAAGAAEERDAAIVMLDIRGFTGVTSRLPPRQVVELLTSLHARILPIMHRHNGVIDKFLGDGIMATFGVVERSETAAADALQALDAVMLAAQEWRRELNEKGAANALEVHGAAVAGPVLAAVLGAGDRLEYTVIGPAVNLAAKLEKHNKAEGSRALTTRATLARAEAQGYRPLSRVEHRPQCTIMGASEATDIVVLMAADERTRQPATKST